MPDDTQQHPTPGGQQAEAETAEDQGDQPQAPGEAEAGEKEKILPPNSVAVEDLGKLKRKVTVTIPREKIEAKRDEMFGELMTTAQVPGFRVGRAPRRLIEKRFGREVTQDVRNALVGESLGEAIDQAELKVLGQPEVDLEKIELPEAGELAYSFEVEIQPEFELPECKGIQVEKHPVTITDDRVAEHIDRWRQMQARYEATDGPAAEGDAVSVDARVAGEGIDQVQHKGLSLRVAPGQVEGLPLVELGKALAGKAAGETASLTVKVPEAHPNEAWRSKEATVELKLSQVRRRVLPELNDGFAASFGFDSLAAFRERMRTNLEAMADAEVRRSMRDQVRVYLLDHTDFELPEGVAARHTARVLQRRYVDLLQQGVPREQIDERLTELQAAASQQAQRELKLTFILGKVADAEGIEVSDDEVNARVAQIAARYNRRPERLRQELANDGSLEQVQIVLREEKALDKLLEQAEVTEAAEPTEAKPPAKKAKKAKKKRTAKAKSAKKAASPKKARKATAKRKSTKQ